MRTSAPQLTAPALAGYAVAKLGPGLLTFASVPIWVRGIGVAEYATFSQVWALVMFAGSLSVGWLRQGTLRLAGDPAGALRLLPRWAVAAAVLAPIPPVVVWLLIFQPRPGWSLLVTAGLFCATSGLYGLASIRAVRDQRATLFAAGELVRVAGGLVAWFPLSAWGGLAGADGVLAGSAVGALIATALLYPPPMRRRPPSPRGADAPAEVSGLLGFYWRYGWPMSVWLAVAAALVYVDRFVIALFLGQEAAGQYAAVADMIVRGMGILAFPVSLAVQPVVMAAWNTAHHDRARMILRSAARLLGALLVGGVIVSVLVGPWLVSTVMPDNPPGVALVATLAVGAALWQYALLAHKPLEIAERTRLMLGLIVASVVVTILVDAALIPTLGPLGAAVALAVGAGCYTAVCAWLGPRILGAYAVHAAPPIGHRVADRAGR